MAEHPWHYDQKNRRAGLGVKERPASVAHGVIAPSVAHPPVITVLAIIPYQIANYQVVVPGD